MKIFKKNFVGISLNQTGLSGDPLAFLIPYEDNAAGRQREDTVRRWLGYYSYGNQAADKKNTKIIDNEPRTGFRILDFANRNMTDNKFIRIHDPAGFELEISIDNMVALALETTIICGSINGNLIWARDGANNRLILYKSDSYKKAEKEGSKTTHEPGDVIVAQYGKKFVYMGKMYRQWVAFCGDKVRKTNDWGGRWIDVDEKFVATNDDSRAYHVYYKIEDKESKDWNRPFYVRTLTDYMKGSVELDKIKTPSYDMDTFFAIDYVRGGRGYDLTGKFGDNYEEAIKKARKKARLAGVEPGPYNTYNVESRSGLHYMERQSHIVRLKDTKFNGESISLNDAIASRDVLMELRKRK